MLRIAYQTPFFDKIYGDTGLRAYIRIAVTITTSVTGKDHIMKKRCIDIFVIMAGALIFALAINVFVIPNELGEGGVTGVTIILYYLFQWSPGLVSFILNSILLIVGYKFLDKNTTVYTIIAVVFNSLFLHLTQDWRIESNELIINTIFGESSRA